jgi:hypothetical protein
LVANGTVDEEAFGPSFPGESGIAGDSGVDLGSLVSFRHQITLVGFYLRFDGLLCRDQLRAMS